MGVAAGIDNNNNNDNNNSDDDDDDGGGGGDSDAKAVDTQALVVAKTNNPQNARNAYHTVPALLFAFDSLCWLARARSAVPPPIAAARRQQQQQQQQQQQHLPVAVTAAAAHNASTRAEWGGVS